MHPFVYLTILSLLFNLSSQTPTKHAIRAGAPSRSPIPSTCTLTNPLPPTPVPFPHTTGTTPSPPPVYAPSDAFYAAQILYSYYLSSPPPLSNASSLVRDCEETCYGYGHHTECKAAWFAYQVPSPPWLGGGVSRYACLNFKAAVRRNDTKVAASGTWVDGTVRNIDCPEG